MTVISRRDNKVTEISSYGSHDAFLQWAFKTESHTKINFLTLRPGGLIGYHKAPVNQIMIILNGVVECRSNSKSLRTFTENEILLWEEGEYHETLSENGAKVLIIEGSEILPGVYND